jgi:hypothetical protein
MLEYSDLVNNLLRMCNVPQTHRSFNGPRANGLNVISRVSLREIVSFTLQQTDVKSWLLYSEGFHTSSNASSSTVVSIGSLSSCPSTTLNGHATVGHHAGGKCSHNPRICSIATPWNQKLSFAIKSPQAKTCTRIDSALGLRFSSSSVHLSGKSDDMAMIRRAVALLQSDLSRCLCT